MTELEKNIRFHLHEANRARFFGMMEAQEHHIWMAKTYEYEMVYGSEEQPESVVSNVIEFPRKK